MKPVILSLAGPAVTPSERQLFRSHAPMGFILFARNIVDRDQVKALTDDLRDLTGRDDLPILVDQEGGRVQRLRPPSWPAYPAPARFGELWERNPMLAQEAARANASALGADLAQVGINVDCLPLLDVPQAGAHDAIGDRAFDPRPSVVAALGRAVLEGLAAVGVVGVVKHMPGQGRARVDSHVDLPVVESTREELQDDFLPFRTLRDAPMGMTGHVVFTALDPGQPASTSRIVLLQTVRQDIGFAGFLMSDDLEMGALSGTPEARARAVVEAGCDAALNCWGRLEEMASVLDGLPDATPIAVDRLDRAMRSAVQLEGSVAVDLGREAAATRDALFAAAQN